MITSLIAVIYLKELSLKSNLGVLWCGRKFWNFTVPVLLERNSGARYVVDRWRMKSSGRSQVLYTLVKLREHSLYIGPGLAD